MLFCALLQPCLYLRLPRLITQRLTRRLGRTFSNLHDICAVLERVCALLNLLRPVRGLFLAGLQGFISADSPEDDINLQVADVRTNWNIKSN
jgi:hypothetical protein